MRDQVGRHVGGQVPGVVVQLRVPIEYLEKMRKELVLFGLGIFTNVHYTYITKDSYSYSTGSHYSI